MKNIVYVSDDEEEEDLTKGKTPPNFKPEPLPLSKDVSASIRHPNLLVAAAAQLEKQDILSKV
jgi:hypothetical protein